MSRLFHLLAILWLALPVQAGALRFDDALRIAEQRAPSLLAADAGEAAASAASRAAGTLPDPTLFVGLENLPVSGRDAWSPERDGMTMQTFGLSQQIPNGAKRAAARASGAADIALAGALHAERRSELRTATAVAWIEGWHLRRQRALLDTLASENDLLAATIEAAIATGQNEITDVYAPVRQAVALADRQDDLRREEAGVLARLTRYVGATSIDDLAGDPPRFRVDAGALRRHVEHHPELQRFVAELDRAEAALRDAVADRRPDWGVELAFQRRGPAFGDMVSLQFSIDLPVAPAARQDPIIEARRHDIERILAEREDMLRDHSQALDELLGEHASLSQQLARATRTLVPALERQVELLTKTYAAGSTALRELLDARQVLLDERLRLITLESRRQVVEARLHYAYEEPQS